MESGHTSITPSANFPQSEDLQISRSICPSIPSQQCLIWGRLLLLHVLCKKIKILKYNVLPDTLNPSCAASLLGIEHH